MIKKILSRIHPYYSVLDYNLNWKLSSSVIKKLLGNRIVQVIDIGARGLSLGEIDGFKSSCDYVAFDADEQEASRLEESAKSKQFFKIRIFPIFIGESSGEKVFHIYHNPGESSSLEPDEYYAKSFSPNLKIRESTIVKQSTLDEVCCDQNLQPDLIKLDTQGTELNILLNSENALDGCLIVETEAEIIPIYKDQPLLHDISGFLYSKGFQLLYLNRVFGQKVYSKKPCRGQLIFSDALFGITPKKALTLSTDKQIKYCCLLINYGLIDSAIEIHDSNPEIAQQVPAITDFLNGYRSYGKLERLKNYFLAGSFNRLFVFILSRIRTNGLNIDSDRSWNIR